MAILASIAFITVNPTEQFKKAQDSKRKSDLSQIQRALESYYQDFGRYPQSLDNKIAPSGAAIEWGQSWQPYLDVVPIEPSRDRSYAYWVDEVSGGQAYRLYAALDRAAKDESSCAAGAVCPNLPDGVTCVSVCNFGVASPNVSP